MDSFLMERFTLLSGLVAVLLCAAMLLLMEAGFRIGRRHRRDGEAGNLGTLEGGVLGLMGLLLAFSFSGAANRFDQRRALIVEEANDIGTAWLRLDLLPVEAQPAVRDSFRSYVDARIATYKAVPDYDAVLAAMARANRLQGSIWTQVVEATRGGWVPAPNLILPALNSMFDITTTRAWAVQSHPPTVLFGLLVLLILMSSLLAGYGMSGSSKRRWSHIVSFIVLVSLTLWIIFDLEYPRLGFIEVENFDQAIGDVRNSMK